MFSQSIRPKSGPTIKLMQQYRVPLRIVFYQDDGRWIAHCLEFDLVGDGDSTDSALRMLVDAIGTQVEASVKHGDPASLFVPADARLLAMFAAGKEVAAAELHMQFEVVEIEKAEFRKYIPEHGGEMAYTHA